MTKRETSLLLGGVAELFPGADRQALGCLADLLEKQHAGALAEIDEARTILAGSDSNSLPNDWTLVQVARSRMADLARAWDRVERGDARAASLEADLASATDARRDETRSGSVVDEGAVGAAETPQQFHSGDRE